MIKAAKILKVVAALGFAIGAVGSAQASLNVDHSYGDIAAPGVYFGAGNLNGDFTITNVGNVELALRAKTFGAGLIDGPTGTYQAHTGLSPNRTAGQTPRLDWNYEFSLAAKSGDLSQFAYRLGVDNDPTSGVNFTFVNPLTYFGDNAKNGLIGSQNSENGIFLNTPGGMINPFLPGIYSFELAAYDVTDLTFQRVLGAADIIVNVTNPNAKVPEPESIALLGLGLLGLVAARRRKA